MTDTVCVVKLVPLIRLEVRVTRELAIRNVSHDHDVEMYHMTMMLECIT